MEPNNELPPVERPKSAHQPNKASENLPPVSEIVGNAGSYSTPVAAQPDPQQQVTGQVTSTAADTPAQPAAPVIDSAMIADETDLIEKEWVDKAKAIVAHTKNDPHLQNKEMSKVKAEYLKKRYNKDLKLNEE